MYSALEEVAEIKNSTLPKSSRKGDRHTGFDSPLLEPISFE